MFIKEGVSGGLPVVVSAGVCRCAESPAESCELVRGVCSFGYGVLASEKEAGTRGGEGKDFACDGVESAYFVEMVIGGVLRHGIVRCSSVDLIREHSCRSADCGCCEGSHEFFDLDVANCADAMQ